MDKKGFERRLEAAEKQNLGLLDEIKNLKEKLAEMQDEPEIPDLPNFKCGESYWTMFDNFALSDERTAFVRDATEYNMFHTEAYAQEFANKCKLIAMMLHCKWYLCYKHHPDFNDCDIQKWTVVFDYKKRKFTVEFSRTREWSTVYFDTEENAQKCADWLNEHWKEEGNDT